MSTFDVPNILPDMFTLDDPSTGAKSVVAANLYEIPAQNKVDFDPTNQRNIRFKLTSPGDFLIGSKSYLKFDLVISGQTAVENLKFGLGGAHALWRNIQVRTLGGGTLLQEIDWYNMYQGIVHQFQMNKDWIRTYGPAYGETSVKDDFQQVTTKAWRNMAAVEGAIVKVAFAAVNNLGQSFTFDAAPTDTALAALKAMRVGDRIVIRKTDAGVNYYYEYICTGVLNALNTVFHARGVSATALADGNIVTANLGMAIQYTIEDNFLGSIVATQPLSQGTNNYNVTMEIQMQPFLTLLQHNIPLFLWKDGLELILELDTFNRAFVSPAAVATTTTYKIQNPKFMAYMVTPHSSIQERYETLWRSDKGLIYRIPSVKVRKATSTHTGTGTTMQFHVGVRSAMNAILLMNDSSFESSLQNDITRGFQFRMGSYQFKIGSINFPQRQVDIKGYGQEAYKQLLCALDVYGQTNIMHSLYDYANNFNNSYNGNITQLSTTIQIREPCRFYIGVDFRRVTGYGENLSGIDLSHVPLDFEYSTNNNSNTNEQYLSAANVLGSGNGELQYYLFVNYDAYLKVNSQNITVMS
jgi:hypothetical protein